MSIECTYCLPLCREDLVSLVCLASAQGDAGDFAPCRERLKHHICFAFLDRYALQYACRISECEFLLPVLTWRQDLRAPAIDQT